MKKTVSILLLILSTITVYSQIGAMSSSMRMHQMAVSQHRDFANSNMNLMNYYRNQSFSNLAFLKNEVYKIDTKIKATNSKISKKERRLNKLKEKNNTTDTIKINKINTKITSLNSKLISLNEDKNKYQDMLDTLVKEKQKQKEEKQKQKEERKKQVEK